MSEEKSGNSKFNIKEELSKLPKKPGVYIMHDNKDEIIYVGKAVNLFNRVRSYFRTNIGRGPKIDRMVSLIEYFEYIVTDSELEALVLENDLIKEHRPKYNTMLMDDKTYPYIRVTVNETYPRIMLARQVKKDKAKYFGPYTSGQAVRDVIDLINKIYKLRTCNKKLEISSNQENEDNYAIVNGRYCLNYHMKQCMGPCQGCISDKQYMEAVRNAMDFLNGNYVPVQKMLKDKMLELSDNMEYEEAAKYRDLLGSVNAIAQKQKIEDNNLEDKDVIGIAINNNDAVVQIFFVRNGKMVGREHFHLNISEEELADDVNIDDENVTEVKNDIENIKSSLVSRFIMQFYAGTPYIPREIYLPSKIDDEKITEEWLTKKRGSRVFFVIPKIGQKERLVELANKNAAIILEQDKEKIKLEEARTIGAVHEVEEWLGLAGIERMEAFDISNISGFENVGSMVVFEKGKSKKSDYRKFKIKTVAGPDDYACMREVLTRRFVHGLEEKSNSVDAKKLNGVGFAKLPDLLLMDGGRGQVNIALEVLNELRINIPVAGMVKDDNHRTRGLFFNNIEIPIDTHSEGFKLITRIQDEAHRFAIEYHRSLRRKDQVHSVLDDIPGVGPSRRQALMKAFNSLEEIKNSTVEELIEKTGMPVNAAESIIEYLNKH